MKNFSLPFFHCNLKWSINVNQDDNNYKQLGKNTQSTREVHCITRPAKDAWFASRSIILQGD